MKKCLSVVVIVLILTCPSILARQIHECKSLETQEIIQLVDEFEQAFKEKKPELLFDLFTMPATESERNLKSTLLYGHDSQGIPGGPLWPVQALGIPASHENYA